MTNPNPSLVNSYLKNPETHTTPAPITSLEDPTPPRLPSAYEPFIMEELRIGPKNKTFNFARTFLSEAAAKFDITCGCNFAVSKRYT